MKNFFITSLIFSLISLNLTGCQVGLNSEDSSDLSVKSDNLSYPKVDTVKIGESFEKEFSVIGEVFPEKESIFTSKVSDGIIGKINVKIGDFVRRGQVLMEISSEKTLQNYVNAKNNYNKALAAGNQSIQSAKVNLKNTQIISEKQGVELADNLSSSKLSINLSIQKAESDLDSVISLNEKTEKIARENVGNSLETAKILSSNSLNEIDKILGIEDVNEENSLKYENYLGNLKSETLSVAKLNYRLAENFYTENKFSSEYGIILEILKKVKFSSDSNLDLLKNSTTGPNFTNTELQSLITKFSNLSNSLQSSINSLISLENSFNATIEGNKKNLVSAQNALEIAKNQSKDGSSEKIISAESAYEKNLENLKNSVKIANESLNSAKTSSQQNIASMLSNLRNAEIAMQDLKIVADFDGEISNIFVENGTRVGAGTKLVSVSNNTKFKIITFLSKSQIAGINIGDEILIGTKSIDKIFSISSSSDLVTKKYKVEIIHENPFLSAGEFVNIKFTRENISGENKIFLPLPGVFISEKGNFIWVIKNISDKEITTKNNFGEISTKTVKVGEVKKVNIKTGNLSGNNVEVLEGLEIGDLVISGGGRFLKKDGENVEIN